MTMMGIFDRWSTSRIIYCRQTRSQTDKSQSLDPPLATREKLRSKQSNQIDFEHAKIGNLGKLDRTLSDDGEKKTTIQRVFDQPHTCTCTHIRSGAERGKRR